MKRADSPKNKASVPDEEARQPLPVAKIPPDGQNQSKKLTFAKNVDLTEKISSQRSSLYKDVLSQPPMDLSHSQRLIWLQKRRTAGLWAQCDDCDRWRYLPDILDRHDLPKKWYCWMNTDKEFANCSVPEAPLRIHDEEDLIHSEYSAGSLVWARLAGWPWWPAMVDDCPDTEQYYWLDGFSDIPTHYNVVFFDNLEATRAWISPDQLKPYSSNKELFKYSVKSKKYNNRLKAAMTQANEAEKIPLEKRLERYSFIARHKGNICSPRKLKKNDLKKYQKQFKMKFNVDFPIESSESDDDTNDVTEIPRKNNNNVIILGTPKRPRRDKSHVVRRALDKTCEEMSAERNDSLMNNSEPQPQQLDNTVANTERPSNSMVVQVGSTQPDSIDNDTSATYVPENETPMEFSIRIDTPNSDDFDF